jgi:hypothetical protein
LRQFRRRTSGLRLRDGRGLCSSGAAEELHDGAIISYGNEGRQATARCYVYKKGAMEVVRRLAG